jgi:hypothetical protein
MTIFQNKLNKKRYFIEHLVLDIHHLNRNDFAGIYAFTFPVVSSKDNIYFKSQNKEECLNFVNENFEPLFVV